MSVISLAVEKLEARNLLAAIFGTVANDRVGNHRLDHDDEGIADALVWIDRNDNGKLELETDWATFTDEQGRYGFENLFPGVYHVRYAAGPGLAQTSPQQYFGWRRDATAGRTSLVEIDYIAQSLRDLSPPTLENRAGLIKTIDGKYFGAGHLLDTIVEIDPATGSEKQFPMTDKQFVAGLAYDPIMDELFTLASETEEDVRRLYRIDRTTGSVTPVSDLIPDIAVARGTSALAFNWISRELISYNNGNGTFFRYDLQGNAQELGRFSAFPFYNLSFDGFRYLTHRAAGEQIEFFEIDPYTATAKSLAKFDGVTTGNAAEILAANQPQVVELLSNADSQVADFLTTKLAYQQASVTLAAGSLRIKDSAAGLDVTYPLPNATELSFCLGLKGFELRLAGQSPHAKVSLQLSEESDQLEIEVPDLPASVDGAGGMDTLLPIRSMALDLSRANFKGFDILDLGHESTVAVLIDPAAVNQMSDAGRLKILVGQQDVVEANRDEWTVQPPIISTERRTHVLSADQAILEIENQLSWQNPLDKHDVNRDGILSASDVLHIINLINSFGGGQLSTSRQEFATAEYVDVNGDRNLTPIDALSVITEINGRS